LRPFSISRFCPQLFALLVLAASLVASCVTAFSAEVGLAWDASTSPEVLGYKIYYGLVNDVRVIDVGNVTTYRVKGLEPDTYWFCVTAYDLSFNESGCSNVVSITLPPPMYGFAKRAHRRSQGMLSQPDLIQETSARTADPVVQRRKISSRVVFIPWLVERDVGYVSGNPGAGLGPAQIKIEPKDREIADVMSSTWVSFAATGDLNGPGLPKWPKYQEESEQHLEFGDTIRTRSRLFAADLDFWAEVWEGVRKPRR